MGDERWLRDALAASVPEPPPTDRADGVRRRRRRAAHRRNVAVGGGAAAAIAVLAATSIVLYARDSSDPTVASEISDPRYDGPACPAADAPASGPSTIPRDPVSVRLCRGAGTPIDPPRDALVDGAAQVAAVVDGLGPLPSYPACTLDVGPGYRLVFAY